MTSHASEVYNVMVHSFTPGAFRGIIFLSSEELVEGDAGSNFGAELSALANSRKKRFGGEDSHFFYTTPSKALAPKATQPEAIRGKVTALEIGDWSEIGKVIEASVE